MVYPPHRVDLFGMESYKIFVANKDRLVVNMKKHKSEINGCQVLLKKGGYSDVQKDYFLYGLL